MLIEMWPPLGASQLLLVGVCLLFVYYFWPSDGSNLPKRPWGLPIIGNTLIFSGKDVPDTITNLKKEYGRILYIKLGSFPLFFLQDIKLVKEAFIDKAEFTSSRPMHLDIVKKLTEDEPRGIFFNVGESFKQMRRFSLLALRDFGVGKQSIEEKISSEADAIINVIANVGSEYDSEDFRSITQRGVSNVVVNICFGQRLEYGNAEFIEVQENLNTIFSIAVLGQPSSVVPWLKYIPCLPNQIGTFLKAQDGVIAFIKKKVDEHRDTFDPDNIRDFTDHFLKHEGDSKDSYLNMESLFRTINDLFQAGTETTASALTWTLFFMCTYPDVQEKVHEQIDKFIGPGRKPVYGDRHEMPYVDAVFNEILRLANIEEITLAGYTIPKQSMLMSNTYGIHMDKEYWGDPDVFRPERFLNEDGTLKKHEPFLPFSVGKRSCIGEHLSRMEMYLFIVHFMQQLKFRFPDASKQPLKLAPGALRKPASFKVIIEKRTAVTDN